MPVSLIAAGRQIGVPRHPPPLCLYAWPLPPPCLCSINATVASLDGLGLVGAGSPWNLTGTSMVESSWIDAMVADARNDAEEPADLLDFDRFWVKRSYLKEKSFCAMQPLPKQAWRTLFEHLAPIKANVILHRMGPKVGG